MTEYCNVAFIIDPKLSCQEMFTALRNLDDYCDVYINYNDIVVDYEPNGEAMITVVGEMPDLPGRWDNLVKSIPDIPGISIDYDTMREWI